MSISTIVDKKLTDTNMLMFVQVKDCMLCFRVLTRASTIRVGVNLHDRTERTPGKYFQVRSIVPHPNYRRGSVLHDIAVLSLTRPVPNVIHGKRVNRVELPPAWYTAPANSQLIAVGWGDVSEGIRDLPQLLQGTRLRLLSPTLCNRRTEMTLPPSQICVDNTRSDTCQVTIGC